MVEQCRTDLIANGENPDDYFFKHEGEQVVDGMDD